MNKYKISCLEWNELHIRFGVYDGKGAHCGVITIEASDVRTFLQNWAGAVFWNGLIPNHVDYELKGAERAVRII